MKLKKNIKLKFKRIKNLILKLSKQINNKSQIKFNEFFFFINNKKSRLNKNTKFSALLIVKLNYHLC